MNSYVSLDTIKSISLFQKKKGYRFTIDSVLLADFVNKFKPSTILDIGAGNGIVGILLARKYPTANVSLVEIQEDLSEISKKNVVHNGLENRVTAHKMDIREVHGSSHFSAESFDIIVTNPPFRIPLTGKISPYDEKAIARHEIMMNSRTLMESASYLLKPRGYFYIIFHPERLMEITGLMRESLLEPKRVRFIYPDTGSESKMVLIEAIKGARKGLKVDRPLILYQSRSQYTDEVLRILEQ